MTQHTIPAGWTHATTTTVSRGELDALADQVARQRFVMQLVEELEPGSLRGKLYVGLYWCRDRGSEGIAVNAAFYPPNA